MICDLLMLGLCVLILFVWWGLMDLLCFVCSVWFILGEVVLLIVIFEGDGLVR